MPVEFTRNDACIDIHEQVVCGSMKLVMAYDGSDRRISKTRMRDYGNGVWETQSITHYTGIGTEIRENFAGESPETKVVVNMPEGLGRYGVEEITDSYTPRTAADNANASFEWYLKNHIGSTMLVFGTYSVDEEGKADLGVQKAAYDYRAFGEQMSMLEVNDKVTETFAGKELDDEIALNYFGARYLDPMLGLWISVDAAGQHFSPYTYGSNNPISSIDPDGNEDVYYLLGGNKNAQNQNLVTMSQFKAATEKSAEAFRNKGYTVKYANMTKASFNRVVKDPEAKKIYLTGHVNKANGKVMSQRKDERWLGAKDIQENKNIDLNIAGCRSQGLVEKQWGG